jgi:hypothetical protein
VVAQSTTTFAAGEAQRVYNLLDELGCFETSKCDLKDFEPSKQCDFKTQKMRCDATGRVLYL